MSTEPRQDAGSGWLERALECASMAGEAARRLASGDAGDGWLTRAGIRGPLAACEELLGAVRCWLVDVERREWPDRPDLRLFVCQTRTRIDDALWIVTQSRGGARNDESGSGLFESTQRELAGILQGKGCEEWLGQANSAQLERWGQGLGRAINAVGAVVRVAGRVVGETTEMRFAGLGTAGEGIEVAGLTLMVAWNRSLEVGGGQAAPRPGPAVIGHMLSLVRGACGWVGARGHWRLEEVGRAELDRWVTVEMVGAVSCSLRAVEAVFSEIARVWDEQGDDGGWHVMQQVAEWVGESATVINLSAKSRISTSAIPGETDDEENSVEALRALAASLLDGSAREFGVAVAAMEPGDVAGVLTELRVFLAGVGKVMLAFARCGRGVGGYLADGALREAARGRLHVAVVTLEIDARQLAADAEAARAAAARAADAGAAGSAGGASTAAPLGRTPRWRRFLAWRSRGRDARPWLPRVVVPKDTEGRWS